MKKLTLKENQLFCVKILAKNKYRPFFYWDIDALKTYEEEVAILVISLLKKRTMIYFGLKSEGMDFDLDGNPLSDFFQTWVDSANSKRAKTPTDLGWDLLVNSLYSSVPNQPLQSWVKSDQEFAHAIQGLWNDIYL